MKIKPGVLWPAVIASALAIHVIGSLIMVYVATTNDSYAVEPDYYQKAIAWDERRAQERHNDELGWSLDFTVEPARLGSDPTVRVELRAADGAPLTDARVMVEAFSNIRRDDIFTAALRPAGTGYEAEIPMHGNGRWEFRFTVTRDQDVFTYRDTRHIWTQVPE